MGRSFETELAPIETLSKISEHSGSFKHRYRPTVELLSLGTSMPTAHVLPPFARTSASAVDFSDALSPHLAPLSFRTTIHNFVNSLILLVVREQRLFSRNTPVLCERSIEGIPAWRTGTKGTLLSLGLGN